MTQADHSRRLTELDLGLSPTALDTLAAAMRHVAVEPGEFVLHQGEPGDSFHLILSGTLDVISHSASGKEIVFRTLGAGDPLGELTVVDGARRLASVRAATAAELLSISRSRFRDLALEQAELGLWLALLCAEKTRRLSEWAEGSSSADIGARLAALLLEYAADAASSTIRITQQALADRLGVTRESINRHLGSWAAAGTIELKRGRVILIEPEALAGSTQF